MKSVYRIGGKAEARVSWFVGTRADGLITLLITARDHRGQGHATQLMKEICAEADKAKLPLRLAAVPDYARDFQRLVRFYERHGFKLTSQCGYMRREPKEPTNGR